MKNNPIITAWNKIATRRKARLAGVEDVAMVVLLDAVNHTMRHYETIFDAQIAGVVNMKAAFRDATQKLPEQYKAQQQKRKLRKGEQTRSYLSAITRSTRVRRSMAQHATNLRATRK
jgi:hypothetical protein